MNLAEAGDDGLSDLNVLLRHIIQRQPKYNYNIYDRRFPPNCSINGMGHTSEQCKVLSDYAKIIRLLCQINKVDMKMIEKFKKSLLWC